jgi:H+/Cl- antiporter ClcA
MSSFRGGPVFPSLMLGAAGGVAMSHLPGLPLIPAAAMGMGAMSAVMLRLPLTAVLLATLLLFSDGLAVMPVVIVAVVVAYLTSLRIAPASWALPGTPTPPPPSPVAGDVAAAPGRKDDTAGRTTREGTG